MHALGVAAAVAGWLPGWLHSWLHWLHTMADFQVRQGNISLAARRPVEIYIKGTAFGSDRIYLARTTAEQACGCR